jgi:hypothetical protein
MELLLIILVLVLLFGGGGYLRFPQVALSHELKLSE